MERPLILIGGGAHCKSVIEACRSCGRKVIGVMDLADKVGGNILGIPIIATEYDIQRYVNDVEFVVTVGFIKDSTIRNSIINHVQSAGGIFGTVVASTAHVSPFAELGPGTVVLHGACINACAKIGSNVIVNTLSNIDHDVVVADNCHISTCASLNGMSSIGQCTFVGSQAAVCQCVNICHDVVIGAGSVITKNISIPGVYAGVPARMISERKGSF